MISDKEKVKFLVSEILEVEVNEIKDDSVFTEDFGASSLAALDILARLEQDFAVSISEDDLGKLNSVNSIMDLLTVLRNPQE